MEVTTATTQKSTTEENHHLAGVSHTATLPPFAIDVSCATQSSLPYSPPLFSVYLSERMTCTRALWLSGREIKKQPQAVVVVTKALYNISSLVIITAEMWQADRASMHARQALISRSWGRDSKRSPSCPFTSIPVTLSGLLLPSEPRAQHWGYLVHSATHMCDKHLVYIGKRSLFSQT